MRDVKRQVETYSFYDRSGIAAHLDAMAAKGWQLESMTNLIWTYRRSAPQRLRYAVTYYPGGSAYDPEPNPALAEFYELCEHEGWERVAGFAEMQIFVNRREDPLPLETDPLVELDVIERSVRRRLTRPYWILLAFSALFAFLGLGNLFVDPVYALSGLYSVPAGIYFALSAAALAAELAGYYRWRSRARKAAAHGESVETCSPVRLTKALLIAVSTLFCLTVLNVLIAGDNLMRIIILFALTVAAVSNISARVCVNRLKRSGSSKGSSRAASFLVPFVVSLALYGALIGFSGSFSGLAEDAYNGNPRYVNYSLSLDDFTDADLSGYIRARNHRESLLLAQSGIDESYHGAYSGVPGHDIGELEYRTTIPKFPSLYGFCEAAASRGGESVDPAPWGALRAYSMGGNAYTLCYDGRIVEISLPFTPTEEQMAIVDEKLGV